MNCDNCGHELSFHKSTMEDLPNKWQHFRGHGKLSCYCNKPKMPSLSGHSDDGVDEQ